ncbi:error-prone DNA polymerase [Planctomicrobium sp. SH668]|uniref:error-prone DNA polymerase n=1 Tax=Planctomicrobium sp. SH668 TaxID=3448126 RepID=UPI003F5B2F25
MTVTGSSYAEIHCKSNFSFLEGASHPDELVQRAVELGYTALAVTDRNTLAGVVRAHVAAKAVGLKLLIGAEITPVDGLPVVLLAMDRSGYGGLSTLITHGRRNAPKGECRLTLEDIAHHGEGLIAAVVPKQEHLPSLHLYRDAFGDRASLLAELHCGRDDDRQLNDLKQLSRQSGLPLVAANDVHYHTPARQPLQDVLTAIRHRCTVAELGERRFVNAERHLKSPAQMRLLFQSCPESIERTLEIASRCSFSLDELKYEYPHELCPDGTTPLEHLHQLTWAGASNRYPGGIPAKIHQTIEHELNLISELRYEAYFLTVWDLVRFARSKGILCQGRGSAANSAVCYCLGVTSVDPKEIDLLFERFISKERGEAPDIDIDFEHERREEVIQYVYDKYGRDRAGMTATLITYRPRSAIRDVGKALGLSLDKVDRLAKNLDHFGSSEQLAGRLREAGLDVQSRLGRQLLYLTTELLGFPRHLSQHVGGMVMTQGPLHELVPIENASMPGRTVIEWDKDDLDALGLLKVDCLSLGMLTAIRKTFDLVERHYGSTLTLATIPQDDPLVYRMIQRADTVGVFQIESRAQMSMLPRLKPEKFYDLVIEVAIVRPGPIQGDMVHPYLRRRRGEEEETYPDDKIKAVLHKTLGVPLFQEQAMKLAIVAAGFTPGEADQLRRAMAAWKRKGGLEPFRIKLIEGMKQNGYDPEFAERLYKQICGFGEYGFPESHSASFALLAYVSAWLKYHYPAAFTASLINSQPMGFYGPAQLVEDARKHHVPVLPVDINHSDWDCTLESVGLNKFPSSSLRDLCASVFADSSPDGVKHRETEGTGGENDEQRFSLRLGLRMVAGISEAAARKIMLARQQGRFRSMEDFVQRTGLPRSVIIKLSRADAFGSLSLSRRAALWNALPQQESGDLLHAADPTEPPVILPTLAPFEEVTADYQTTGLSLKAHPISFLREQIGNRGAVRAVDLQEIADGMLVKIAGLVLLRQRPGTAKGVTFMTIEDETDQANLVVWQNTWERFRRIARHSAALLVTGKIQKAEGVIHVVVTRMQDLTEQLAAIPNHSRDFR